MDADEQRRDAGEVLRVADPGLGHERCEQDIAAAHGVRRRPNATKAPQGHDGEGQEEHDADAVEAGDVGHVEIEAPRGRVARMGPGPGDDRAQENGQGGAHHDEAGQREQLGRHDRSAGAPVRAVLLTGLTGPVVKHDGVPDEEQGEEEVAHHVGRRQVVLDRLASEHDLRHDPEHEPGREHDQVAPAGPAYHRPEHGQDHRERHDPRDDAVDELDHRMEGPLGHDAAVSTRGPVGTPQAGAGQANRAAGDDDERQRQQGHERDAPVGPRREAERAHVRRSYDRVPALSISAAPRSVGAMSLAAAAQPLTRRARLGAYVALTKPRIIELLLVTTVPTMVVAARGVPSGRLVLATLVGGALAAGGANAVNMYVDRDIDRLMVRTRNRPLVTGAISPRAALTFAIVLELLAFAELWALVNLLSAVLAVTATLFYVFVYSLWLKRTSRQNIVIGGAAGAVPVLVGWAAVRDSLGMAPLVLFAIIFVWTPPHFWALAIRYRDDYRRADVPMMPTVVGFTRTARQIVVYTVLLWAASLVFYPVARMGDLYLVAAIVLGAIFLWQAVRLLRDRTPERAMRLFGYSISYLTLLFAAMAVDQLLRG